MHNTGHWLGIDVHDVGIYRPDDSTLIRRSMVLQSSQDFTLGLSDPMLIAQKDMQILASE